MSFEYIFKYIIIGDSGVGKSCILLQFAQNEFDHNKENTVGVEFGNKVVSVSGTKVKLQIWDTAGQEQFKSITRSYYRAVSGALLVYDVTDAETFSNVKNWLEEARVNANPELVIMLCGNKIDKYDRQVSTEEGRKLAEENNIMFIECSAKERINIDEIFLNIAMLIKMKIEDKRIDPNIEEYGIRRINDTLNVHKQPAETKLVASSTIDGSKKKKKKCC